MTAPVRNPEIYRIVTDMEALQEAFRDRVEDLDISRIELDALADLTPGYSSKLLCDPPMKFVGKHTLPKLLKGTKLRIALIEDDGSKIETPKRKYKIGRIRSATSMAGETQEMPMNIEELMKLALSERIKEMRKTDTSSKRQARRLKQRARQRRASHAARLRWSRMKK